MADKRKISLTEILIGIAVILLITLVIYPKFIDIIRKSNEAATRANLTAMRSAIAIYYGDNEGNFPTEDIAKELIGEDGKYIKFIPEVYCPPYHNVTKEITTTPTGDSGKWAYQVEDSEDRQAGELWIDCNHEDSNGVIWNSY